MIMNRFSSTTVETKHAWRRFPRGFAPHILEIPMFYDDADAREAGREFCDRALLRLGSRSVIHLLPWKLTVARYPVLTEIVAREAMHAPFVLVTLHGAKPLSPEVESFIRRCAAAMNRGGSALVLQLYGIEKDKMEFSPVYRCLNQIAKDSKIPFFLEVIERGAGRAFPRRNGSPFVAFPPQTTPTHTLQAA